MEKKRASKAVRQRKIYYRKKETGLREKPVPSFYSQHFLCPIDGKLCPGGRGPQFIFRPQLGSCGHVVEGVSLSGWSGSLEKLVPAGEKQDNAIRENRMPTRAMWPLWLYSLFVGSPQWAYFNCTLWAPCDPWHSQVKNWVREIRATKAKMPLTVVLVAQSCPTLCPPGSSVHGIIPARILEWVAISFSRGFSGSRDETLSSCHICITGRLFFLFSFFFFNHSATREHLLSVVFCSESVVLPNTSLLLWP